jgi:hypothetical protein
MRIRWHLQLAFAAVAAGSAAHAQLYVSQGSTVGEYDATTGAAINANFITGLSAPVGLALSGNTLFVANNGSGTVGEYNATTGAAINANFITGLSNPTGLALSGNTLFVANQTSNTVGEYNATTGAAINASFITGLSHTFNLALSGNTLFVGNGDSGPNLDTVGEYNATTGAAINATFLPLFDPTGIAVSGNTLFVSNYDAGTPGGGTVGEYNATTGAVINANFITGLNGPEGLVVSGNTLFVANWGEPVTVGGGTVGAYNATTGAAINANFITGLTTPWDFAVAPLAESISGLNPNWATAGLPGLTLAVDGSGFLSGATVQWNGSALATSYINGNQLTATVSAGELAAPGSASVTVVNPGGSASNAATFTIAPNSALGWTDDFDSYALGSFPSTWTNSGNNAVSVVNTFDVSPPQSLQMYGVVGGCWAALAHRQLVVSPPFAVQVSVRNNNEALSGCHPGRGILQLFTGPSWTTPAVDLFAFDQTGNLWTNQTAAYSGQPAGQELASLPLLQWNTVAIAYGFVDTSTVSTTYWINGQPGIVVTRPAASGEASMTWLTLDTGEGTAWFDNVEVTAAYTISGKVTLSGSGLSGVTVTLSGSQIVTTTTDGSGNYSFNLPAGGNYTVTPSATGYSFSPPSKTFTSLSANQTAGFTATCALSVNPTAVFLDSTSQSGPPLSVTTSPSCSWVASTNAAFIEITSGASGSGNGTVTFSVPANTTGAALTGTLSVNSQAVSITQRETAATFNDVQTSNGFFDFINTMYERGITAGCATSPLQYCPNSTATRDEMAVFIITAIEGGETFSYTITPYFTDVPPTDPFFKFVQKMKDLGITSGCSATMYCPDDPVTRGEMAVFIIKGRYGAIDFSALPGYSATQIFGDEPPSSPFYAFIQEMAETGITGGCGSGMYCPNASLTRGQMAVFVVTGLLNQLLPATTPLIATAVPNAAAPGQTLTLALGGVNTHFVQGTTQVTMAPGITPSGIVVINDTSLTVQVAVSPGVVPGPTSIVATTGTEEAVLPNGFTVQ